VILESLDKSYRKIIQFGIIGLIWFGALARGAHDFWSASLLFFVSTILFVLFCIGQARRDAPVIFPMLVPLLFFIGAMLLSVWNSYDVDTSLFELWGWLFIFLLFFLFMNAVDNNPDDVLNAAGFVLLPMLAVCVGQQWKTSMLSDVAGSLVNPAVLAGFVLYWILFFGGRFARNSFDRVLWIACVLMLFMAKSATAFLCVGLGYLTIVRLVAVPPPPDKEGKFSFLAAAVFCVSGLWLMGYKAMGYYAEGAHRWTGRIYYWLTAIKMWRRYPWYGVGLGSYGSAFPFFRSGPVQNTLFAHSFPVSLLSETGIIGFCAMILVTASYLRQRPRSTGYQATLAIVFAYSLVNMNLDYLINKLLFVLWMGASLTSVSWPRYRIKPIWFAGMAIGAVLITPFWLKPLVASRLYVRGQEFEQEGHWAEAQDAWLNAIVVDKFQSDSYQALAQAYSHRYAITGSPDDRNRAIQYLTEAVRFKRDIRYVREMDQLKRGL